MVYKPFESEVKQSKFRKIDRYKLPITTCPYSPKHNDSEPGNHSSWPVIIGVEKESESEVIATIGQVGRAAKS